jgi:cyclic pyranopterin phosphate synthase
MVDVGDKAPTKRLARAAGRIRISRETFALIEAGKIPKGHPFEIARFAGIAAAKRTADLIPLCHPLRLTFVDLEIQPRPEELSLEAVATVVAEDRTGVEMEALVGCTTALLTIYDMLKAVDRDMMIGDVRLLEKTGGRTDHQATT